MSDSYTILDKQPEVLSCLDEVGERVTPERWAINNEIFKDKNKKIEQLKKENEKLRNESKRLVVGFRTINRRSSHHVPESITGDDEPCYWQRKEWIDYIFDLCENVEILLTTNNKE